MGKTPSEPSRNLPTLSTVVRTKEDLVYKVLKKKGDLGLVTVILSRTGKGPSDSIRQT